MHVGEGTSGIPQPSMLRGGNRLSMAPSMFPSQQQQPLSVVRKTEMASIGGGGFMGAQTPARATSMHPTGAPMSHARNTNAGNRLIPQTPGTSRTNRRVSVFASSRRITMGITAPGTITRGGGGVTDPRPIRERGFQAKAQQRIMTYLSTHGYQGILTPKTLSMPTVKDFETIFKFLYAQLDPRFVYAKKFPEDSLIILRGIHYPYVSNISKSHIYSAGSQSSWPNLLAMLLWLVELIECVTKMNPHNYAEVQGEETEASKDSTQFVDRVFFDYLSQAYPIWLESGEEPQELETNLAQQFEQKNASLAQETTDTERKLANAKQELEALTGNESPLVQLDKERVDLITDKVKMEEYIQRLENRRQRLADVIGNQKQQQDAAQIEQMALEKKKAETQVIVDAQEISAEDVDRMNSERNQLLESLTGVQGKVQEATKKVWAYEMDLQRVLDDVDTQTQEYSYKAHKLGLVGARRNAVPKSNSHGEPDEEDDDADVEMAENGRGVPGLLKGAADPLGGANIELSVDTRTDDRYKVTSVDLRREVRPALQRASDVFASQLHATQSDALELGEQLDQLSESRMEQEQRVMEMEKQVKRHNQRYRELREAIMSETQAATTQIEQLEADISAMRRDISQGELQSKAALSHAETEWESVQRGCRMRRGEINEDVMAALEDLVQMKTNTESRLNELLELVATIDKGEGEVVN